MQPGRWAWLSPLSHDKPAFATWGVTVNNSRNRAKCGGELGKRHGRKQVRHPFKYMSARFPWHRSASADGRLDCVCVRCFEMLDGHAYTCLHHETERTLSAHARVEPLVARLEVGTKATLKAMWGCARPMARRESSMLRRRRSPSGCSEIALPNVPTPTRRANAHLEAKRRGSARAKLSTRRHAAHSPRLARRLKTMV